MRAAALALALAALVSRPASAQDFSLRPFALFTAQQFAATQTFEATFGQVNQPFWGGGLSITQDDRYYLDLSASRFEKTGSRAFFFNGTAFSTGVSQKITITPLELTAGYRFHPWPRVIPTVGGGVALYRYKQVSDFSTDEENVDSQHAGAVVEGGVEFRLHRWIGVAADVHYAYVPGILGEDPSAFSTAAGEKNLGGVAARVKLIVGK
jgi:outer membrane protein W